MVIAVQNINPLYFLQPLITIAFSAGLVVYWHLKRLFTAWTFLCSLIAYVGAIACKVVFQAITFSALMTSFHGDLSILGVYFGAQTVVFEVGGSYVVAAQGVSRGKLSTKDSEAYGLGLAFWENAGYIGILGLFSLLSIYLTLSVGTTSSVALYSNLVANRPALFYPSSQALPLIGFSILERVTSLLFIFVGVTCPCCRRLRTRDSIFWLLCPWGYLTFSSPMPTT